MHSNQRPRQAGAGALLQHLWQHSTWARTELKALHTADGTPHSCGR